MSTHHKFIFRKAAIPDINIVRDMIQELAEFEKMSDGPKLNEKDLINDSGLDGGKEFCHIYLLELQKEATQSTIPIGYAICFFSYSTWEGKSYFLEDIYIRPDYRKLGAGAYMFKKIAGKAKEFNCKRLDFHVLSWNPAGNFYANLGAKDLTESEDWHLYRLEQQEIEKFANESC